MAHGSDLKLQERNIKATIVSARCRDLAGLMWISASAWSAWMQDSARVLAHHRLRAMQGLTGTGMLLGFS
jgi:hypothetical protein